LKRPQINDVQYLGIPSRILKGVSHEEVVNDETDKAMVETNNDEAWQIDVNLVRMECRGTKISCMVAKSLAEPPDAC
jgi:hypothetical protein